MPVSARRFLRKMRGGAQAHLLEAADGNYYIVKFANNPQSKRILVNEWIASVLLGYLEITQPKVALIEIGQDFLDANPEAGAMMDWSAAWLRCKRHEISCSPVTGTE